MIAKTVILSDLQQETLFRLLKQEEARLEASRDRVHESRRLSMSTRFRRSNGLREALERIEDMKRQFEVGKFSK